MRTVGYFNGEIAETEDLKIPALSRAVYFGDGCYEAAFVVNRRIFQLENHVNRFFSSMKLLKIQPAWTREELCEILKSLVAKLDSPTGHLYWQADRGTARRAHVFPADAKANLLVFVNPAEMPDFFREIKLISLPDIRFEICNIKTLNLIPSILASEEARKNGVDETVLHRRGVVTECAHSNISILKNGVLYTHPADNFILPGTVRHDMLNICAKKGIPVIERAFTLDELRGCDEALVTASFSMIRRAVMLDGEKIGGRDYDTCRLIQAEYKAMIEALYD
ncbi:MAG: D-amino acid aminotransferase [Clostridiales bacterium]|nr:D-amino acid aminotransferase [Clostridiales bacterium]